MNKVNMVSIILPIELEKLTEALARAKAELDPIPPTDLSENEVWHQAKGVHDDISVALEKKKIEFLNLKNNTLANNYTIESGDLLRIQALGGEIPTQILMFRKSGNPLLQGVLGVDSPLGQAIQNTGSEGQYTILSDGQTYIYNVSFVKNNEQEVINEFLRTFSISSEEKVQNLMEQEG